MTLNPIAAAAAIKSFWFPDTTNLPNRVAGTITQTLAQAAYFNTPNT